MGQINKPHSLFYCVLLLIVAASIELLCFAIYKVNPASIFDWHFYDQAFNQTSKPSVSYGWSSPEPMPRPATYQGSTCAVAFGDSFTYGEEVQTEDTWEDQASFLLNCKIDNYGVGGFGTDQTLLLYQTLQPQTDLVIVGLYPEMMKRNLAASWIFYGSQKDRPLKPYFNIQDGKLVLVPMPVSNSIEEIKNYHRYDSFFQAYDIKFPYAYHVTKAILIRARQILAKRIAFLTDTKQIDLQAKILSELTQSIKQNQAKVAFIVFPSHIEIIKGRFSTLDQLLQSKTLSQDECIIHPGPELHAALNRHEKIFAQMGHLSRQGNLIVAKEVAIQLKKCNLLK